MNQLELIQSKIYEIRGQRVMLDFDLAQMYGTETAQLKRAVRRNKKRFDGEDFMFEVTRDELSRCQIGTLNKSRGSNIKYLPFAFAMLSSVLNSETAIEINKGIMRAFVAIRQLIANPPPDKHSLLQKEVKELKQYIEEIFTDQNDI
ncbi:ORF6N domain-containing protein, partial [Odoribacter splanchnicus]